MLIVALVLALIGLGALVMAVVTSNELIAWVCIAASVIGVVLLIVDALRDRSRGDAGEQVSDTDDPGDAESDYVEDYPDEAPIADQYDDTRYDESFDDGALDDDAPHDGALHDDALHDEAWADDTVAVDAESRTEQSEPSRTGDDESPKN